MSIASINDLPMFDGDIEAKGLPASVVSLREQIRAADAVMLSLPEYNYSFSAAIKNALDWASRTYPGDKSVLSGKPASVVSAAGGSGGIRAQAAFRSVAWGTNLMLMNHPEVAIRIFEAPAKFDGEGNVTDEKVMAAMNAHVQALAAWARKFKQTDSKL